jgi:predicted lipoprotein with Yx(FWY)xxD motif
MMRIRIVLLAAAAGLSTLVACGSSPSTAPSTPPTAGASASAPPSTSAQTGAPRLIAATVGRLGTVVTDGNGVTLYRFDKDSSSPSASNCNGTCAANWPPTLAGSGAVQVTGVSQSRVGSVTRADGTKQITLNGWPLYRYAKDTAAGQANGQGIGGTWFAVTPQGKKATAQPLASPTTAGGGYGY